jgi:RND family efflux transporter MFP subunit
MIAANGLFITRRNSQGQSASHPRMRFTQCVSVLALAALLLATGACSYFSKADPSKDQSSLPVVAVTAVTRRNLQNNLTIAAEFHPFQEIAVDAKVPGYIKQIFVDVGDHVHEGQVLAILEIPELEDQLRQNKAAVLMAQQQIDQARAELQRDESSYTVAHLEYTRLADVMKTHPDLVAQQDVDDAQGKDQGAEAQVAAAKANLGAAQAAVSVAKANEEKTATLFAYARIVAPFTGIITRRYADTGAMLPAGTSSSKQELPLVQLSQNDLLRLEIPVPEDDTPKIQLGTPVEVHVKVLEQDVQGKVARFADSVDMNTRTMLTEVDVPNPDYKLIPGMYADVSIMLEQRANAVAVPIQALHQRGDTVVGFVVNGQDHIEERSLNIGIRTGNYAEILSGLQPGDRVAVSQLDQLRNGQMVEPRMTQLGEPQDGE